ncbi:MAG: PorP/SprF family type IX secretion system membrane protein [Culturomica sp.]|jgi:type IX secretion system PorP/SprF family membrane protein|nr:PorP/SprF family type IX secretion system membrane protein [Culturomica sp.]
MQKILTILILLSGTICTAQNELFSRQYFLNHYLMNPAVGGINDYMDLRASYSRQWTAIENSPTSMLLTFNTNLAREKDQVLRYSPFEKRYTVSKGGLDYYQRRIKHGVGTKIIYDKINGFTYTDVTVSYAAHVPLTGAWTLSAGVGGGMSMSAMDLTGRYLGDESDPLLNGGKRNEMVPLVEAGVWLYSTGPYIGASLTRYMEDPYDEEQKTRYMNIYATAGWQLPANQFVFVPSVMYKNDGYSGHNINVNAMLWFSDIAWAGASLRNLENPSVHVGLLWRNTLELNYTYDVNKSEWGGSHEIGIAYRIWNKADDCKNKWYFK